MALSLLEVVTRAGQGEDASASRVDVESSWGVSLQPTVATTTTKTLDVVRKGKGVVSDDQVEYVDDLIVRETGEWRVGAPSGEEENLVGELKEKLENLDEFSTTEFVSLVRPVLESTASQAGVTSLGVESVEDARENGSVEGEKAAALSGRDSEGSSDEVLFLRFLREGGGYLGRKLLASIVQCSIGLQFWDALKILLECGLVSSVTHPQLVQKLVEHRQARLLFLCFHHVLDLTPSDIMIALKFLLEKSPASQRSCEVVRQDWRIAASAAIDRADKTRELALVSAQAPDDKSSTPKKRSAYRGKAVATAIAMAAAVDGFQGWEVCLHGLVASGQDEAVLAAITAELDIREAVQLLRYLHKWLDRYSKRLADNPSPGHKVPSLQQVLQWVNVVLDGQYMRFVLVPEFLPELKALQVLVQSLVAIGTKLTPLLGVTEHIRSGGPLPAVRPGSDLTSDYIIEFLDIS